MSDPTAAEAAAEMLWRCYLDTGHVDSWSSYGATKGDALVVARDVLDALGIDPDAPLSLLHWHAAAAQFDPAVGLDGEPMYDQDGHRRYRRSDRL